MLNVYLASDPDSFRYGQIREALTAHGMVIYEMDKKLPDTPKTGVQGEYIDACVVVVREGAISEWLVAGFMRGSGKPVLFYDPSGYLAETAKGMFSGVGGGRYYFIESLMLGLGRIALSGAVSTTNCPEKRRLRTPSMLQAFDALLSNALKAQMHDAQGLDGGDSCGAKRQPVKTSDWSADQRLVCQNCHSEYRYGSAKTLPSLSPEEFLPAVFCCGACQLNYLHKHKSLPAFGAEIPLGKPEICNLGSIDMEKAVQDIRNLPSNPVLPPIDASLGPKDCNARDLSGGMVSRSVMVGSVAVGLNPEGLVLLQTSGPDATSFSRGRVVLTREGVLQLLSDLRNALEKGETVAARKP